MNAHALALAILLPLAATVAAEQVEESNIATLYRNAVRGNKDAVEPCIAALEARLRAEPDNQLTRAYLGSCYTLRSRDMGFGPAKLRTLNRGIALMNEAVAAAPNDPQVRLVRARTTDALPAFLGHRKTAREDFTWLAGVAEVRPDKFSAADLADIRSHTNK